MAEDDIRGLDDESLKGIVTELTRYAHLKVVLRRRVLGRMAIPADSEPDDFVQEALRAVLFGERNWNRDVYPTLLEFLKSVVDSMLSNWGRLVAFRTQQATSSIENTPEIANVEGISTERCREIENELYRILEGRDDAVELLAVLEGELDMKKRGEIAEEWGLTPDEVTNARKRLIRLIESDFNRDLLDNLN